MALIEVYHIDENQDIPRDLWRQRRPIAGFLNVYMQGRLGYDDTILVSEDSVLPFLTGHPRAQQQYIERILHPKWTFHHNTLQYYRNPPGWVCCYWVATNEADEDIQFYFFIADFKGIYLQWGNA